MGNQVNADFQQLVAWFALTVAGVLDVRVGPTMPAFLPVPLALAALPAGLLLVALGVQLVRRSL